jgi:hypothetical protein
LLRPQIAHQTKTAQNNNPQSVHVSALLSSSPA